MSGAIARATPWPWLSRYQNLTQHMKRDAEPWQEAEVVRLILQGHSSLSISLKLDISMTTVKTHRKNAYAKLNISSQSELLARFLSGLGQTGLVNRNGA